MTPKIDIINLGVTDLGRAREFYELGLAGAVREEPSDTLTVSFDAQASRVALRPWDAVASDAGVEAQSSGFRAFTLSYILDSAEGVDEVLRRAEAHGGTVSKAPKNAFWGYSAYVTDPSGYLWKIASSKRHPLLGRRETTTSNGRVIRPQEIPITIGVADMKRAKQFYEDGIGLAVKKSFGNKFVMFDGQDHTSGLGMYKREALAHDAAVAPEGSGFHGFTLTHLIDTAERVDDMLARAVQAGGRIVKSASPTGRGGYSGYYADLDGNLWRVASRT